MWPNNYFGGRYWNGHYWAKVGDTPPPPTGQSPAASRYRAGYRTDYVYGSLVALVVRWLA